MRRYQPPPGGVRQWPCASRSFSKRAASPSRAFMKGRHSSLLLLTMSQRRSTHLWPRRMSLRVTDLICLDLCIFSDPEGALFLASNDSSDKVPSRVTQLYNRHCYFCDSTSYRIHLHFFLLFSFQYLWGHLNVTPLDMHRTFRSKAAGVNLLI